VRLGQEDLKRYVVTAEEVHPGESRQEEEARSKKGKTDF